MGYSIESTVWPTIPFPDPVKALMDKFFMLMDNPCAGVGDQLADEVFTCDGSLSSASGKAIGTSEIRQCRDDAWKLINRRHHQVLRVYTHSPECSDLMLIGQADMKCSNGTSFVAPFTARMVFANVSTSEPKIQSYEVWADTLPLAKALSET